MLMWIFSRKIRKDSFYSLVGMAVNVAIQHRRVNADRGDMGVVWQELNWRRKQGAKGIRTLTVQQKTSVFVTL